MQELISNFTNYKISGFIAVTRSASGAMYAVPANSFAIVNIMIEGVATININGAKIFSGQAGANGSSSVSPSNGGNMPGASLQGVYVGPGMAINVQVGSTGNNHLTGVLFTNSGT